MLLTGILSKQRSNHKSWYLFSRYRAQISVNLYSSLFSPLFLHLPPSTSHQPPDIR